MTGAAQASNSYDEIPYSSHPFAQSHPDRLSTIARLFGMQPKSVEACRVLELGCGGGGNLIPMAEQLPDSHFVGIDLSEVQIKQGQEIVRRAGLRNIELHHCSILDCDDQFGKFDYILSHGVFSWVPREVQEQMFAVCSKCLSEIGVAYISYNTYPGWHMRDMIRDMMCYHTARYGDPRVRISEARALLDFMEMHANKEAAFGRLLHAEARLLRNQSDSYLFHEHLEEVNEPIYFYQFIGRAAEHGLSYLGEAEMSSMYAGHLPREVKTTLERVAEDLIQMEQYMDFIRNRTFRQTLLCRQDIPIDRELRPSELSNFYVASSLRPTEEDFDPRKPGPAVFRHPQSGAQLATEHPLLKAVMAHLGATWPANIAFPDLIGTAWSRVNQEAFCSADRFQRESEQLGTRILEGYVSGIIELSTAAARFSREVPQFPRAARLAQCQAEAGEECITNLLHQTVRLGELGRQILPLLDGTRDRDVLLGELLGLMRGGKIVSPGKGIGPHDTAEVRERVSAELDKTLVYLANSAVLQQ